MNIIVLRPGTHCGTLSAIQTNKSSSTAQTITLWYLLCERKDVNTGLLNGCLDVQGDAGPERLDAFG